MLKRTDRVHAVEPTIGAVFFGVPTNRTLIAGLKEAEARAPDHPGVSERIRAVGISEGLFK